MHWNDLNLLVERWNGIYCRNVHTVGKELRTLVIEIVDLYD